MPSGHTPVDGSGGVQVISALRVMAPLPVTLTPPFLRKIVTLLPLIVLFPQLEPAHTSPST